MERPIIYNLKSMHRFTDYGIQIPLLNKRVIETVNRLKEITLIKEENYSEIPLIDLGLAHSEEFLKRIQSDPVGLVEETYELVNKDGSYNRYNPSLKLKPLNEFISKARLHIAGTYLAAKRSLNLGFCYHLGGGMHHAMSFRPGGFCMFNDLVISIRKLQQEKSIVKAGIIDLDCHKGDGSAEITQNDNSIKTFSIHMKNGWPLDGDRSSASFIPSDMDIPVERSDNYIELLKKGLNDFLYLYPDLDLILVVHGVDVWEHDILPSAKGIQLSTQQVLERDDLVYSLLKAKQLPQAWCLGGGYGPGISALYLQFLEKAL